jgi:hypothetical protein
MVAALTFRRVNAGPGGAEVCVLTAKGVQVALLFLFSINACAAPWPRDWTLSPAYKIIYSGRL